MHPFHCLYLTFCILLYLLPIHGHQDAVSSGLGAFVACLQDAHGTAEGPIHSVASDSADYAAATLSTNFRTVFRNLAVVYPKSVGHVKRIVQCGVQSHVTLAPRGGGHGYEGLSQDVLVDMSGLSEIRVHADNRTVTVGAGARQVTDTIHGNAIHGNATDVICSCDMSQCARLGPLYHAVSEKGFVFPGGTCATASDLRYLLDPIQDLGS